MLLIKRNVNAEEDLGDSSLESDVAEFFAANVVAECFGEEDEIVLGPGERVSARAEPAGGRVDHRHLELWFDFPDEEVGEVRLAEENDFLQWNDVAFLLKQI